MPDETNTVASDATNVEQVTDGNEQQQGTVQWDSPENPYRQQVERLGQQYSGLQGNFNQLRSEREQLLQTTNTLAEEIAELRAKYEGRTAEEAATERLRVREGLQTQTLARAIKDKEAELEAERNALAQSYKPIVLNDIAKKYGVDVSELQDCDNWREADRLARKLSTITRQQKLDDRRKNNTDTVEPGGGSATIRNVDTLTTAEKLRRGVEAEIKKAKRD